MKKSELNKLIEIAIKKQLIKNKIRKYRFNEITNSFSDPIVYYYEFMVSNGVTSHAKLTFKLSDLEKLISRKIDYDDFEKLCSYQNDSDNAIFMEETFQNEGKDILDSLKKKEIYGSSSEMGDGVFAYSIKSMGDAKKAVIEMEREIQDETGADDFDDY